MRLDRGPQSERARRDSCDSVGVREAAVGVAEGVHAVYDVRALPDVHGVLAVGRPHRVVYGATIADAARTGKQIEIPAAEVAKRGDMTCVVDGPVEEGVCLALFTDPRMEKQFEKWKAMMR